MAARAVGRSHRAVLRGEPVVALHECADPIRWEAELRVDFFGGVALRADLLGDPDGRTGPEVLDLMLRMAIDAGGGLTVALRPGLAVDALGDGLRDLLMALAAGGRQLVLMQARAGRLGRDDIVLPMAVDARGGALFTRLDREGMGAALVGVRLVRVAEGAIDFLRGDVVVGMFGRDVRVAAHARVGPVRGFHMHGIIDEKGHGLPQRISLGQGVVGMTLQTVAVWPCRRRCRRGLGRRRGAPKERGGKGAR